MREEVLNTMLSLNANCFENIKVTSNGVIQDNGGRGHCLLFSLLHADGDDITEKFKKYGITDKKIDANAKKIRELFLEIFESGDRGKIKEGLDKYVDDAGDLFELRKSSQIKGQRNIYDTMSKSEYKGSGYLGEDTLRLYSKIFKKHVIIFQLASLNYHSLVNVIRYDDNIPFINGLKPNYIFLARYPGEETHYVSLSKIKPQEPIVMKYGLLRMLNKLSIPDITQGEQKRSMGLMFERYKKDRQFTFANHVIFKELKKFKDTFSFSEFIYALNQCNNVPTKVTSTEPILYDTEQEFDTDAAARGNGSYSYGSFVNNS